MSLRVYAIFRRDKRMLYVLLVYLVAAVTLALVDLVFSFVSGTYGFPAVDWDQPSAAIGGDCC